MKNIFLIIALLIGFIGNSQNAGQQNGIDSDNKGIKIGDIVKMSGNWFIAYRNGISQTQADDEIGKITKQENGFVLKRSYITLKKDLNKTFSVRYTMDLTIDKEGNDAGNVETRLKYLYVKVKPKINTNLLTNTWIEAGMVHTPWLDYEQKINTYRVQDNMFIERNKIFNSADFGITIGGNIGPAMDKKFLKEVNGAMKGKWFTYCFGLYNGGGYSGAEKNNNKVISGRISARPFANSLPELHISGYFNKGKGNTKDSPEFNQFLTMLAYTSKHFTLTSQYHTGRGDFRAKYVKKDNPSFSYNNNGYSFFSEYRIHKTPLALWGRYDSFTVDKITSKDITKRIIGGITYRINKNLRLVLNMEHNAKNTDENDIYELNLEVSF